MKKIHRIWLGGQMPERYQEYGHLWEELNPDYKVHDWTEEEIFDHKWMNQGVLDRMHYESNKPGADMIAYYTHVADVIDYEIIYNHGGIYCNTDLKPIKPLNSIEDFKTDIDGFAYEDDVHLVNMFMHGPKNSMLFERIIGRLPIRYFGMPGAFMNATTGVQLIMEVVSNYLGPLRRYHRNVFNPIHFSDFNYGETPNIDRDYPEETVAVHLWHHRSSMRNQRILEI